MRYGDNESNQRIRGHGRSSEGCGGRAARVPISRGVLLPVSINRGTMVTHGVDPITVS